MLEIGWVDFSDDDRKKVATVIESLRDKDAIDELGIGPVRNAISNKLFPGTSTIQTRAIYFFIIPYILKDYLRLPGKERKVILAKEYLRREENRVMHTLAKKVDYREGNGVIGVNIARHAGAELARKASSIYWNGLRTFEFIRTPHSLPEFLEGLTMEIHSGIMEEDGEMEDKPDSFCNNGHFSININHEKNWKELITDREGTQSLELTPGQGQFFKERILETNGNTFIGWLVNDQEVLTDTISFSNFYEMCLNILSNSKLPPDMNFLLQAAFDFSAIMEGSYWYYNYLLQKLIGSDDDARLNYEEFQKWTGFIQDETIDLKGFDVDYLFSVANNTPFHTKHFIKTWVGFTQQENFKEEDIESLIRDQEFFNKKARARLRSKDILPGINYGIRGLEFRYSNARVILQDIHKALENE